MKRKRIVLVGLCWLVITGLSSALSIGTCQQSEGTDKSKAVSAQQAAPPANTETKGAPPANSEAIKEKAQAVKSPAPRQPDEKTLRKFQATENCAGG